MRPLSDDLKRLAFWHGTVEADGKRIEVWGLWSARRRSGMLFDTNTRAIENWENPEPPLTTAATLYLFPNITEPL